MGTVACRHRTRADRHALSSSAGNAAPHVCAATASPWHSTTCSAVIRLQLQQPWQPQWAPPQPYQQPELPSQRRQSTMAAQHQQQGWGQPVARESLASPFAAAAVQQREASGSGQLVGPARAATDPGQRPGRVGWPHSLDSASVGSLPPLASLPLLSGPLISAAVPAEDVPVHPALRAFYRARSAPQPSPPTGQQQPQQSQQGLQGAAAHLPPPPSSEGRRKPPLHGVQGSALVERSECNKMNCQPVSTKSLAPQAAHATEVARVFFCTQGSRVAVG